MYKLDFKKPLIEIDGKKPSATQTLASMLAELIGTEVEGRTLKLYGWYRKLIAEGVLELDKSDKTDLYDLIEKTNRIVISVKGQLLEVLDGATEKA